MAESAAERKARERRHDREAGRRPLYVTLPAPLVDWLTAQAQGAGLTQAAWLEARLAEIQRRAQDAQ